MDLLLITEGWSKYDWNNIFQNPPQERFGFERGVTIKGKVVNATYDQNNQVMIYPSSISNMRVANVNNNKDYVFENAYVIKGDSINLTLLNSKGKALKPRMTADFLPFAIGDSRKHIEGLLKPGNSSIGKVKGSDAILEMIAEDNIVALENVTVYEKGKENKLTQNPGLMTGIFDGVKISPKDVKKNVTLSRFMRSLGYRVVTDPINSTFSVVTKVPLTPPPVIILNGNPLGEALRDFPLESVDEVYYEHLGTHGSPGGTIYIYRKNGSLVEQKSLERFAKILATEGFSRPMEYYNPKYSSYNSLEFLEYGVVHWEPKAIADEKGMVEITFPDYELKSAKLFIEGMDMEGGFVSEVKVIQLDQ